MDTGCLIERYNQLTSSHGEEIILAVWRASGISAALENGLIGFIINIFNKVDPLTIKINITSVLRPMSEEYNNKENVFNNYDSGEVFRDWLNLDFNRE